MLAARRCLRFIFFAGLLGMVAPPGAVSAAAPEPGLREMVIVHPAGLAPAAEAWAKYRAEHGEWSVLLVPVPGDLDNDSQRAMILHSLRERFAEVPKRDPAHFCVLLLGDAEPEPNASNSPADRGVLLPAWRFRQSDPSMGAADDPEFISDQPYQTLRDGDVHAAFPLGRIPARSNHEAMIALEKIRQYESSAASEAARRQITYVAGEGHFGAMDHVLESLFKSMVDQIVPDAFDLSMTYAKATSPYCPPPSRLADTVLERLSEGCLLFNYLGHGSPRHLDSLRWGTKRIPILRVQDLHRLPPAAPGTLQPIAFMSCCSVGHFDLPNGDHCLSEAMLLAPGGPVAVISGSRVTHPYANTVLQKDITQALLVDRAPTVGLLDLMAERSLLTIDAADRQIDALAAPIALAGRWATSLSNLRRMHVKLYNLLGDPAMRISLPKATPIDMSLDGPRIVGTIAGMKTGTAVIRLQSARTSFADPWRMQAVIDEADPELETKAANNYPLANKRMLHTLTAPIIEGRFEIALPQPLPAEAAMITASAEGTNEQGEKYEAIGAMRVIRQKAIGATYER